MIDIKDMLQLELDKAKVIYDKLEELSIQIVVYQDDIKSDIESLELLLHRQADKKMDQINSAIEFLVNDVMKYSDKIKPKIEKVVKIPHKVIEKNELPFMKGTIVNNKFLAKFVEEEMSKHPGVVYTTNEIQFILLKKYPELKKMWKRPQAAVHYILNLNKATTQKISKGQYVYNVKK